jgi:hypothetical protein
MTRAEWVKAPKNEKRWSKYNKARNHFPLCCLGKQVVLHHKNQCCDNYEEWNTDELVPMFTWCHTHLHNIDGKEKLKNFLGCRKGKCHTIETRQKLSASHTGKSWSEKRRETYLRNGITVSEETRKKLSIAHKGHPGHVFTVEQLKRMSESHKGQIPPSRKGTIQSEETKKKRAESLKRFYASPEGIEKRKLFSLTRKRRGKGKCSSGKGAS